MTMRHAKAITGIIVSFIWLTLVGSTLALQVHPQRSDHNRIWYDLEVTDNPDGTLSVVGGNFWVQGKQYSLSAYRPNVSNGPFRLWVEKTASGADYLLDLTQEAQPVGFGEGVGAMLVAWRDSPGGEIHLLRSVRDE